jgi:unsaturated chondroitin disaccharide hydrolase
MKLVSLITGLLLLSLSCSNPRDEDADQSEKILEQIENQYNLFLKLNSEQNANSKIQFCDGYFAGVNWNMFKLSGHKKFEALAIESLSAIEQNYRDSAAWCTGNQLMAGFGKGIKVTQNDSYREHLINTVKELTHDFDPETGRFYWNGNPERDCSYTFGFESIMNLESLFFIARLTADPVYYNIATKHAEMILNSPYENADKTDFNSELTEHSESSENIQLNSADPNYTDSLKLNSLIVYSSALMFRETGEIKYLRTAERIVSDIYRQFNNFLSQQGPVTNRSQNINKNDLDLTSLAVLASALYDLCLSTGKSDYYSERANDIISVLSTKSYFVSDNLQNAGVLLQQKIIESDGNLTRESSFFIDEYFFLEALIKRQKLMELIT